MKDFSGDGLCVKETGPVLNHSVISVKCAEMAVNKGNIK